MQLPLECLFGHRTDWQPPSLSDLPSWKDAKRVGVDVETCDPHLKVLGPGVRHPDAFLAGVSFAIEDGPSFYLPMRHQGGDNLPVDGVLGYLRAQAAHFRGSIVGANLSYDLDWLAQSGVVFRHARFFRDVQVAEPLLDELQLSYSLDNIARRWKMPGKQEDLLRKAAQYFRVDPKGGLWRLPARYVGPYAEQDAVLPLQLIRRQERELEAQELWEIYDLESRLLPVLVKMRRRGVRVDLDRLAEIERWAYNEEAEALARIRHATGCRIDVGQVWQPEALAPALEHVGVTLPTTAAGAPSIDQALLAGVDHDVARAVERARKVNKLRTTFADSIRRHQIDGRIHCTFNQLRVEKDDGSLAGAAFGRLSSEHPNMQQQPARDEFAKMWRSIYLPEEGMLWAACDYSQQEPRMLTHFAETVRMPGAFAMGEMYRTDPDADTHQMTADMATIDRKPAKTIFLGFCYGMGGPKLCRSLGLPVRQVVKEPDQWVLYDVGTPEAEECLSRGGARIEVAGEEGAALLNTFNEKVPFVREMARATQKVARRRGYIITLLGRRCRFPRRTDGPGFDWAHKALNRLIQGSSGDQTKKAMVDADAAGFRLQLQVHDEIDQSVKDRAEAEALADIMRHCVDLRVPSKVDVEIGKNWGDSME